MEKLSLCMHIGMGQSGLESLLSLMGWVTLDSSQNQSKLSNLIKLRRQEWSFERVVVQLTLGKAHNPASGI